MIAQKIRKRIYGKGRGAVVTPTDFLDLGTRASVDQALSRLADKGVIRRLTRGLYDYPKQSARLGLLSPDPDLIADAIARKGNYVLQISPARAANMFGLTTQVPAQIVYLTDGATCTRQIGRQTIQLRNAKAKSLVGAGRMTGAVFQALRYVGKDGVNDRVINQIGSTLNDDDRTALVRQSVHVPGWMRPVAQRIAEV